MTPPGRDAPPRIASVDVFRGLVLLLLIPNVNGGFSFHQMAERFPDSEIWGFLGKQFSHAEWTGTTVWDLVMPAFVFLIGVAMPLSYAARRRRGDSHAQCTTHALLRAVALFLLGGMLLIPIQSRGDLPWPLLPLAVALPVPRWVARAVRRDVPEVRERIRVAWWILVLSGSALWLGLNVDRMGNYDLAHLLLQVGLAYPLAYSVIDRSVRVQAVVAFTLLLVVWLAFALYPAPTPGLAAHWDKATNLAADFDRWFLNQLPRSEPHLSNAHGYQTLNFVPLVATMIFGILAGRALASRRSGVTIRNGLALAGLSALAAAWLSGLGCPIIKSLWTPSWTVFSTGWVLLILAACHHMCDVKGHVRWAQFLVVLGSNSILMYVLASSYRGWMLTYWQRILPQGWFAGDFGPLIESLLFLGSLWMVAFVLYRKQVFIRI